MATFPLEQKKKIDDLVEQYQSLQETLKKTQLSKQRLMAQQNENESVEKELKILEEDAVLYKLVGPILVKQAVPEARSTVRKRLEYINHELERADVLAEETTKKIGERGEQLEGIQKQFVAAMQQQQQKQVSA